MRRCARLCGRSVWQLSVWWFHCQTPCKAERCLQVEHSFLDEMKGLRTRLRSRFTTRQLSVDAF
uniref:Secreted protein n=1 Tax=Anguilla anguilla TaxID=7936 RepID=A0A0E9RJN6_ANGAN